MLEFMIVMFIHFLFADHMNVFNYFGFILNCSYNTQFRFYSTIMGTVLEYGTHNCETRSRPYQNAYDEHVFRYMIHSN